MKPFIDMRSEGENMMQGREKKKVPLAFFHWGRGLQPHDHIGKMPEFPPTMQPL
jgi:hypothetical protein